LRHRLARLRVEVRINFVQKIKWRWVDALDGKDERERQDRLLAAREGLELRHARAALCIGLAGRRRAAGEAHAHLRQASVRSRGVTTGVIFGR
jgi:hypothetical protein